MISQLINLRRTSKALAFFWGMMIPLAVSSLMRTSYHFLNRVMMQERPLMITNCYVLVWANRIRFLSMFFCLYLGTLFSRLKVLGNLGNFPLVDFVAFSPRLWFSRTFVRSYLMQEHRDLPSFLLVTSCFRRFLRVSIRINLTLLLFFGDSPLILEDIYFLRWFT